MARFGFVGPTYTSQSVNADCQRCVNWYVEANESGQGNSAQYLYPTPGLKPFASVSGAAQTRGEYTINGRTFSVIDGTLYELSSAGILVPLGAVNNDGLPVSMAACPQQLVIASGGLGYVFFLRTQTIGGVTVNAGTFTQVTPSSFPGYVSQVQYCDSFFIALVSSTEQYFVSQSFDASNLFPTPSWSGVDTAIIETFPDNVVSMIVDHRQIWFFGAKATEVDYDAGTFPNPFATVPGGFIEQGCIATFGTVQLDNSIFWIGQRNDQGGGIGWRSSGYSPVRVTNHAVETAWQSYPTLADARAFSYQDQGHSFWHITFPTANATWVYDTATGLWHERGFWNSKTGTFQAALAQCHTFNFGMHLVGDRQSGTIYQMAIPSQAAGGGWNFVTDNGNPIHRMRRAPHVSTEQEWLTYSKLQVYLETGLGPEPPLQDGAGNPRDPKATLRYSKDGGHTWSGGYDVGCGMAGNYKRRAIWRRMGRRPRYGI